MLPKRLAEKWSEAGKTGEPVPLGDIVVCDWCDKDYTTSKDIGGLIFGSKATCPKCAGRILANAQRHGEGRHIRAVCPEDVSFGDFVRNYRGPKATIQITPVEIEKP